MERMETGCGTEITLTKHAFNRMVQRRVSRDAVRFVVEYGHRSHVGGAVLYFVGCRDVDFWMRKGLDIRGYRNLHVIACEDDRGVVILTVYKNEKYNRKKLVKHWMKNHNAGWQAAFGPGLDAIGAI